LRLFAKAFLRVGLPTKTPTRSSMDGTSLVFCLFLHPAL
jgi:hypothetical protein